MTAGDERPARVLRGPAHAHNDGPCDDSCYEDAPAPVTAADGAVVVDPQELTFTGAVPSAWSDVPLELPPDVEEQDEVWTALDRHASRLDGLEAMLHITNGVGERDIRATSVAYAVQLVQGLTASRGLDGEQMREELIKTAVLLRTLMTPDDSTD